MKKFSELGIKSITTDQKKFVGEKVKIGKVFNREIQILYYKVEPSTKNDGECLHLQIQIGESQHVVFTGSKSLIYQIRQVKEEDFPLLTTIVEENDDRFYFT